MVKSDFVNLIEKLLDLRWCIPYQPVVVCTISYLSVIKMGKNTKKSVFFMFLPLDPQKLLNPDPHPLFTEPVTIQYDDCEIETSNFLIK
jgi:hypothetical protein